jgi:hypothetical protein
MKKLLHPVTAIVIALLTIVPGLEAWWCSSVIAQSAAVCPMAVPVMASACPLTHPIAALDCPMDCCRHRAPDHVTQWAAPVKPRQPGLRIEFVPAVTPRTARPSTGLDQPGAASASSPPRFILFRVFRT